MHSSSLWLRGVKPSKKPMHIPSPVQARQGVFLLGPVQERLECENVRRKNFIYKNGGLLMNTNLSKMLEDLERLIKQGKLLYWSMVDELGLLKDDVKKQLSETKLPSFTKEYESWYTESLVLIKQILPDRLHDFTMYYKNEKRKEIDYQTYTISDYLIGLKTTRGTQVVVDRNAALPKFEQQKNILSSIQRRFESSLFDLKQILQADIFDNELEAASELLKKGFLRGAGAVSGVVLEKHLKEISINHSIKISKKNPSISDLNDILKNNNIIEVPVWRFIQHLGDIRNLCDHDKDREPTIDEVNDLICGVKKIIKSIF
jgi:hypothetical protein